MLSILLLISFSLLSVTAYAQGSYSQNENNQLSISKEKPNAKISVNKNSSVVNKLEIKANTIEKPVLIGSTELGFLYKAGNTHSADIKTGLDLRFEKGRWLSLLNIDLLLKKADVADKETGKFHFKTTDQKWSIASQTNYSLETDEKHYVYGNAWYEENKFSSFIKQSSFSTGWGKYWYKTNQASLWSDIGPGFKREQLRASTKTFGNTVTSWIVQAQMLYIRKLNEHVELKQYLSAKQVINSDGNSIYKAETSITTKLISTLQLKFTFTLDYNTEIKDDKNNLDTQTAITLVYSF